MKETEILKADKVVAVFLETLDEKTLNFVPSGRAILQVPFTNCNQNENVNFTLLDHWTEYKVVIFDK